MEGAITQRNNQVTIQIKVKPNASQTEIKGYNEWRRNLKINVKKPPEKGKANREITRHLAEILGIKEQQIEIITGKKQRQKKLGIKGISKQEVLNKLTEHT
ncbi:DUF167 domain-containing protein [Methanonatronarchaeum sp. AMET6-2]|uniref:DUF167 domain-containing protein n=1 Tax=Methanonatronarchaeum sp. AMET6-2 TaxID=2933293 RepID=UPI001214D225|nr:DUF167 domain-containing protein [Methanonatronarchaeum sp. AMET6-2]RZN62141.1 MAG: YggU family protein [Methanonatronarchaeia archaeon]UOY09658.1 DUF167 domain-containing protein [Methanonatronarchaeum sp. AMET6-2]